MLLYMTKASALRFVRRLRAADRRRPRRARHPKRLASVLCATVPQPAPSPWTTDDNRARFIVKDKNGQLSRTVICPRHGEADSYMTARETYYLMLAIAALVGAAMTKITTEHLARSACVYIRQLIAEETATTDSRGLTFSVPISSSRSGS